MVRYPSAVDEDAEALLFGLDLSNKTLDLWLLDDICDDTNDLALNILTVLGH